MVKVIIFEDNFAELSGLGVHCLKSFEKKHVASKVRLVWLRSICRVCTNYQERTNKVTGDFDSESANLAVPRESPSYPMKLHRVILLA